MLSVRSIFASATRMARDLEALVLPIACLGCERPMGAGSDGVLCDDCRFRMQPIPPPRCARCGHPRQPWELVDRASGAAAARGGLRSGAGHRERCGFCRAWPDALALARSAVWLGRGTARRLAHALKYEGWTCAAGPMAEMMRRECGEMLADADVLVPIPLGRARRRERGYNQAAELALALSRLAGLPVAAALERRRETKTQTALGPAERRANVTGAFVTASTVRDRRVVLVDDVLTTGSTLAAAAEALAAGGAVRTTAVTFARAQPPA